MPRAFFRAVLAVVPFACLALSSRAIIDDSVADLDAFSAGKASESLLLDGVTIDGRIYVVGERGHILLSEDGGASWTQQSVPTRSTLTGVWFTDPQTGWAVGHDAVILHTGDGGATWTKQYFDPLGETPLLDVWFADANRGIAVGAYGLYLETSDGGANWTRRPFFSQKLPVAEGEEPADGEADEEDDYVDPEYGEDYHLNHIMAADNGMLFIAAELGRFYRSEDGGQVWYRMPVDYGGSFFATIPLGGDSILLAGMRGNLFRSEDAGLTLEPIETGTIALLGGGFADASGRIVVGGSGGALLESDDNGRSFKLWGQEDRKGIIAVLPAGEDAVILIGEAGAYRRSADEYQAGGE